MTTLVIIGLYLLATLAIGLYAYRKSEDNPDDFFLAGRRVGGLVLFFTLVATNFSAFFFLGFAGAGYRIGYSYYGMMGFGTALVSISFYFIGHKAWLLGKAKGYITPPELIGDLQQSDLLKIVYLAVMVIFTLPYLALQPIGAGILLHQLTDGLIDQFAGSVILSVFIVIYVFLGGMRSVALTDLIQGIIMFVLMFVAVAVIGNALGGLAEANRQAMEIKPGIFSRQGADGSFTPKVWFSYMILWIMAVPMFPQMFMRFFIPKSTTSLRISARLYPLVTAFLFICPIMIGAMGHLAFPDLVGREADSILPRMLSAYAPEWLAATIMVGALAAFMSTMDSQLLALSSMLTRDIYLSFFDREVSIEKQVWIGKVLIVVLSLVGLAIAYKPPATIAAIATQAFTGLSLLFPTTVAVLFWKRTSAPSCAASIIVGEALLILLYLNVIPSSFLMGFLPIVPLTVICTFIIIAGSLIDTPKITG